MIVLAPLLALSLLVGAVFLWPDAPLDPEAEAWLKMDRKEVAVEENIFYPLLGIGVAEGEVPAKEAAKLVREVDKRFRGDPHAALGCESARLIPDWWNPPLEMDERIDALCAPYERSCLDEWQGKRDEIERIAREHAVLLERYRELSRFSEFAIPVEQRYCSLDFPVTTLFRLHRLATALFAVRLLSGDSPEGWSELERDLAFLRRLLRQTDDIGFKMLVAVFIHHTLHTLSQLLDAAESVPNEVAPLSVAERSLEAPLRGELRFFNHSLTPVSPPLRNGTSHCSVSAPFKCLLKPNRTLNLIHRSLVRKVTASELPARQALTLLAAGEVEPRWHDWLLNINGTVLYEVGRAKFNEAALLHELNGLITLVNFKRVVRNEGIDSQGIADYLSAHRSEFRQPFMDDVISWEPESMRIGFSEADGDVQYIRLVVR